MRKASAFLCLGLLLVAGTASATDTRVLTLGETGNILMDESNVMMYPQTLAMWPNLGVINIMGGSISSAGNHMKYGGAVYGGYWTTEEWSDPYLHDFNGNGVNGIDQKITMLYARDLAGKPFGFSFSLYGNKDENKNNGNPTNSGLGIKIGAGMTFMETLETSLQFGMLSWEAKNAAGDKVAENDGGTQIMLMARWWHEMSEGMTMIPHFTFDMNSGGSKPAAGGSTTDEMTTIDLGVGHQFKIGEKAICIEDFGVKFVSGTHDAAGVKTDMSTNLLPYFKGGMETPLTEHWIFRFGGVKEWTSNSTKTGNNEHNTSGAATRMYLGAGYVRGPFSMDMNVEPALFTNGPYIISGKGGAWASQVSMSYTWDKK